MKAMKTLGGELRVAYDPHDSVGIIESYFPEAHFFVEFERFDRHVDKLRRRGAQIDYVTICSPNYLHDAHCRFALRSGAHAICEKPLVLNPWNIDGLAEIEGETGRKISIIQQLRLHPSLKAMKAQVDKSSKNEFAVDLTYVTSRGRWYHTSWKGDEAKSGGVATNVGVHFFDLLVYIFGPVRRSIVHLRTAERAAGYIECGRARVRWFLSVDHRDLQPSTGATTTCRSITVDGEEVEFSDNFTDLHTMSYQEILAGRGFDLDTVRPSVELVSAFRTAQIDLRAGEWHPFVAKYASLS